MGKVQKPSNSEYYTPLSEPFRVYRKILINAFGFIIQTSAVQYSIVAPKVQVQISITAELCILNSLSCILYMLKT
jgi:hypothetical protein